MLEHFERHPADRKGALMQAQIVPIVIVAAWLSSPTVALSQAVERTQDLKPFTTLDLRGCFDTTLVAGSPQRLTVSATAEQHERIRVEQSGDVVTIEPLDETDGWRELCRGERIDIRVSASFAKDRPVDLRVRGSGDLDAEVPAAATLSASVAGSGDLAVRGSAAACEITISGSGDVLGRSLDCATSTEVSVHGSGDVTLQGATKTCSFEVHGSGDVAAGDYACESADVEIFGSGSVNVAKVGDIAVEIHGSGDVTYRGEPKLRRMEVHGSGGLRQL
jgi:hypothetical protein